MLPEFANQTIIRNRFPVTEDGHGNLVRSGVPDSLTVPGCSIQPSSKTELDIAQREGVLLKFTVFCPPDSDIQGGDQILVGDKAYAIWGIPSIYQGFDLDHMKLPLLRWEG